MHQINLSSPSSVSLAEKRQNPDNLNRKLENRRIKHAKIRDSTELQEYYQYKQQIGKGTFGTVYEIKEKKTDILLALKIIEKGKLGNNRSDIEREIGILKIVNHPHIIYLEKIFESNRKYFLVFELCHGTLYNVLQERIKLTEMEVKKIILEISSAVAYLHNNAIVHRDLKLENILLADNPLNPEDTLFVKVSDFGLSVVMTEHSHKAMLTGYCGTVAYMAPEIVSKQSYSQQCDVWAIGVIMYLLLTGRLPFYDKNNNVLEEIIRTEEIKIFDLDLSEECALLLQKLLQKNPAFRITSVELAKYPWLTGKNENNLDNVFDKMKRWRAELMSEDAQETSDWLTSTSKSSTFIGETSQAIYTSNIAGLNKYVRGVGNRTQTRSKPNHSTSMKTVSYKKK